MLEIKAVSTETMAESQRIMEICNACRYCEGLCAVFPAMTLHREFSSTDLGHLANLCHNCKGCYYACQYAPPHPFGVNVPATFALLRDETYRDHVWPRPLAQAFERNGTIVGIVTAVGFTTVLFLLGLLSAPGTLSHAWIGPDAFYRVIPWAAMAITASVTLLFSLLALFIGGRSYWLVSGTKRRVPLRAIRAGLHDAATLTNLGGGGYGCNESDAAFSMTRRYLHHAMAYGFLLCFAATTTASFYAYALHWPAPYPWFSLPVLLGSLGGVGLIIGTFGLMALKFTADRAPAARVLAGSDFALLALLFLSAASGILLLLLRNSAAMGILLGVHLGLILSLFILLPYSKFVHGIYRTLALIRAAADRDMRKTD